MVYAKFKVRKQNLYSLDNNQELLENAIGMHIKLFKGFLELLDGIGARKMKNFRYISGKRIRENS